jgi:hypothetical protein
MTVLVSSLTVVVSSVVTMTCVESATGLPRGVCYDIRLSAEDCVEHAASVLL